MNSAIDIAGSWEMPCVTFFFKTIFMNFEIFKYGQCKDGQKKFKTCLPNFQHSFPFITLKIA